MKVLLLGSGGREHALAWKIAQSPKIEKLYIAPGNAGTSAVGENVDIKATDFPALKAFVLEHKIDMIVVGPEDPLVQGIFDCFKEDAATRHIAIIGGDETYTAATDRTKGALEALSELGIEPAGPIRYGKWDEGWGRAATRLLLDQGVKFDAVVCQNDQLARGCIDVLKQQGLRIPDDVAVIGHDNWSVLTSSSRPALTSIDNETETIGRRAARYLVDAIDGNPHHGVDYVPCHLIQRESTLPLD